MALMLVFDSDAERSEIYSDLLIGHEVIYSTVCSMEAFKVTEGVIPAAIFIESSDPDCLKLISEIRRQPNLRIVMIYLVGEINDPSEFRDYRKAASKCGANGFVPRPIDLAFFQLLVNRALYYHQMFFGPDSGVSDPERQALMDGFQTNQSSADDQKAVPSLPITRSRSFRVVQPEKRLKPGNRITPVDTACNEVHPDFPIEHSNPLSNVAEMIGGWKTLSDIAYEFGLPSDPEQHQRLLEILDGWGKKPPLKRLLKAEELNRILPDWIRRNGQDPVYLALIQIAHQAIQQTRYHFWLASCPILVELIGEWQILDEILGQSMLTDPQSLNRLKYHLKEWNDPGHIQAMVRAANYCTEMISLNEPDPVYQILHQIAAEILYGSEVQRLTWPNDSDEESDDLPRAA